MMTRAAFCHVMEHDGAFVVDDVPTSRLLVVDLVLATALPAVG